MCMHTTWEFQRVSLYSMKTGNIMVLILINNNFNLLSIQTTARQYNTIAKKQEIEEAYSTFTKTMPRLLIQKENIHYGTILSIIKYDFLRDTVQ